jgi:hypothetical protein
MPLQFANLQLYGHLKISWDYPFKISLTILFRWLEILKWYLKGKIK